LDIKAAISNALTGSYGASMAKWMIYIFLIVFIFAGLYLFYMYFFEYKFKVTYFERMGIGLKGEKYSVGKIKKDRIKIQKDKSGQITGCKLLWARKTIKPLDMNHIMPGNNIFLFRAALDNFIPVSFSCGNPEANLSVIDTDIRKWALLEIAQVAQDYQKHDFWKDNKQMFLTLLTIVVCCAFAGFVLWLAFKKTDSVVPALQSLTESVKDMKVIPGQPN